MLKSIKKAMSVPQRLRKALTCFCFLFLALLSVNYQFCAYGSTMWYDNSTGYALGGYDPVAYFTERKALKGKDEYQITLEGAAWRFANPGNKEAFAKNPEIFMPKFSGYDPYGLADSKILEGQPALWMIKNDELYLFNNIVNRRLFLDDEEGYLQKARKNWPGLSRHLNDIIELN